MFASTVRFRTPLGMTASGALALQALRELSRVLAQQLRCAFHIFFLAHPGPRVLINSVKKFSHVRFVRCATDHRENALAEFARELRYASRRFSFECLSIQTSLAGNDKIDILHFSFQPDRFSYDIEARPNFRAAKTHQTKSEPARCARADFIVIIKTKFLRDYVRESR